MRRWWRAAHGLWTVRGACDEDTRRCCGLVMAVSTALVALILLSVATTGFSQAHWFTWLVVDLGAPVGAACFALARRGRDRPAASLLTAYAFAVVTFICVVDGPSGQRFGLMTLALLVAGSVVRPRTTVVLAVLLALVAVAIAKVGAVQALAWSDSFTQAAHMPFLRQATITGLMIFLLRRGYDQLSAEVSRHDAERKATIDQTRQLNESLEHQASERTRHLSLTRERVASIANDVAVDLLGQIGGIRDKLARARQRTTVTDDERLGDLGKAIQAAQRLDAMVANLVDHARLGRAPLSAREVDMNALAREVVEQTRGSGDGARVAWTIAPLPPCHGDPVLVRSVLENLVANAVKFSARRPTPAITIGHDGQRYHVHDNGAGFDPSYAGRLFLPFARLHSRSEYEGQGIGLANVRSIVERHGGDVTAWGQLDRGARFSFSLPRRAAS